MEPCLNNRYKYRYWNIATQKGYGEDCPVVQVCQKQTDGWSLALAGTAVFSKHEPKSVTYVLPDIATPDLDKGRLVVLEFEGCWIVGTYVPNAGQKLKVNCA